jgi:hypothetical protein
MIEEWRPVSGFDGFYEVSNRGAVRSLDRTVSRSDGRKRRAIGRPLKQSLNAAGYPVVTVCDNPRHITIRVHRLVAAAFLPNPHGLPMVNHIDSNPKNNAVENLEWCDALHNMQHAARAGRVRRGENHSSCKLSEEIVRQIRQSPLNHEACAKIFGVTPGMIGHIRSRRSWTHI